ncbi:MAG: PLD nuclease N-terminal domain-containing protein [Jatrophihabitantaceae bacterium]
MLLKLGGLFFIISVLFWLWAIFDCLTADTKRVRNLPRWAWGVLILVFLEFGALAWVMFGRPRAGQLAPPGSGQQPTRRYGPPLSNGPTPRASRPVGPDDDPEFLRNILGPEPR